MTYIGSEDYRLSTTDVQILTLLIEEELYSSEILERVNKNRPLLLGNIHPSLSKLRKYGLIEGYWGEGIDERARRKYYRLTAKGMNLFG